MKKSQIDYVANAIAARCQRLWIHINMDQARQLAEVAKQAFADSSVEAKERKELARLKAKYEAANEEKRAT